MEPEKFEGEKKMAEPYIEAHIKAITEARTLFEGQDDELDFCSSTYRQDSNDYKAVAQSVLKTQYHAVNSDEVAAMEDLARQLQIANGS